MLGMTFFGDTDLAAIAIWAFWLFFAGLVVWIQRENTREGYPLEDDLDREAPKEGLFGIPPDKVFRLPHGRGDVWLPSQQARDDRPIALERGAAWAGAPYIPVGDPMVTGVGPAAWANRRDLPELDGHGQPKIRPMSTLSDFSVSAGRDPRGLPVVAGDGEVVGRIVDFWVDVPEHMIRFLTIDVNPEGTGKTRLLPIHMLRIKADRVVVRSLHERHFDGIPTIAGTDTITVLEEDKIMAYVAGGQLYAKADAEAGAQVRRDPEPTPRVRVIEPGAQARQAAPGPEASS